MIPRSESVSLVRLALRDGRNVCIQGVPGIGKSHIVREAIKGDLAAFGIPVVVVNVNLLSDAVELFDRMIEFVSPGPDSGIGELRRATAVYYRAAFDALLGWDEPWCTIVEDIDSLATLPNADEVLRHLSVLLEEMGPNRLRVCLVGRRPLTDLEISIRGISRLALRCQPVSVGPLAREDLRGGSFPESIRTLDWDDAGECLGDTCGHPDLVRVWSTSTPGGFVEHQIRVFARVVRFLEQVGLLDACAQAVIGPIVNDLFLERRELENLGILGRPSGRSDHVCFSDNQVFRDVLHHSTRGLNPWGLLGEAEVATRHMIEKRLGSKFGSDWCGILSSQSQKFSLIASRARESMASDSRLFGASGRWLDYTYPAQLWQILDSHWECFADDFKFGSRDIWRRRYTVLAQIRTPMAHHRSLSDDERSSGRRAAIAILEAVRGSASADE